MRSSASNARAAAYDKAKEYGFEVKRLAAGRWDMILSELAGGPLEAAIRRPGRHVGCPRHGGKDGFRVFKDYEKNGASHCNTCGSFSDGFATLNFIYGWTFQEALRAVGDTLGVPHYKEDGSAYEVHRTPIAMIPVAPKKSAEEVAAEDDRKAKKLAQAWQESYALDAPEAEIGRLYLRNRGLDMVAGPLPDIRFHPSLEFRDDDKKLVGHFPGLLCLLTQPSGAPLTVQRIFLTEQGAKPVVNGATKKFMPFRSGAQYHGSAVRLDHDVGPVLCVGEGVETMLAFRAMTGLPSWACCVEQLLSNLVIPDTVEILIIASDLDPVKGENEDGVGQMASKALMVRVRESGRMAAMVLPPLPLEPGATKGPDWLDVLEKYGLEGTRRSKLITGIRAQVREMVEGMGKDWGDVRSHY